MKGVGTARLGLRRCAIVALRFGLFCGARPEPLLHLIRRQEMRYRQQPTYTNIGACAESEFKVPIVFPCFPSAASSNPCHVPFHLVLCRGRLSATFRAQPQVGGLETVIATRSALQYGRPQYLFPRFDEYCGHVNG